MARQVQIIKGTTEQNDAFTGAEGVLTYDTETKNLRIHDGATEGGFEIPSSAMGDYVIYWDSADSTDHSHAKPGVSTPTNHGWYRYYKSGWVEQGGSASGIQKPTSATNTSGNTVVEFPIPMANNLYLPTVICTNWDSIHGAVTEPTATSMRVCGGSYNLPGGTVNLSWSIRGQAA